jgi:xanthine phosphoribosyltransferase
MGTYVDDLFVSWPELHRDVRELSRRLLEGGRRFERVLAVTKGGLIPAAIVARELDLRLIDTVCVSSYHGEEAKDRRGVEVLKAPDRCGPGDLVVDDLVDTGGTLREVRRIAPGALFAVVYAKPEGRPSADVYVREVPQTTWIRFPWDTGLGFAEPIARL